MAFGDGKGREYPPGTEFYSFSTKTKGLPAPVFHIQRKQDDGSWKRINNADGTPKTARSVSGSLTSAQPRKNVHEGKDIHSVNLTIEDTTKEGVLQVYFVSVGETFIGRNLYNSLLALALPATEIEIGLYQSKPKPGNPNQSGFASVALRQDGELVKGVYANKDPQLPPTPKVMVNGKNQTDTYQLDLFYRAKLTEWCKTVNTTKAPKRSVTATSSESHTDDPSHGEGAEDGTGDSDPTGEAPF